LNVQKIDVLAVILLYSTILAMSSNALLDLTVTETATVAPSFINPREANLSLTVTINISEYGMSGPNDRIIGPKNFIVLPGDYYYHAL